MGWAYITKPRKRKEREREMTNSKGDVYWYKTTMITEKYTHKGKRNTFLGHKDVFLPLQPRGSF